MPAVEVWLIEFEQLCPMLNNKSWLAASSVARISASVPLAEPSRDQAWSSRRRSAHIALRLLLARSAGIAGLSY